MNSTITGSLVVCIAAAGVAAGALFLEPGDDSPAAAPAPAANVNANTDTDTGGGYGADSGSSDQGATATAAPASLEISGFQFGAVAVGAGGQVAVDNRDGAPHTVTADDGDFDSGQVDGGSTAAFVAPAQPGTYDFHCEIHPDMSGTLTVR
jgi:plastocyanin